MHFIIIENVILMHFIIIAVIIIVDTMTSPQPYAGTHPAIKPPTCPAPPTSRRCERSSQQRRREPHPGQEVGSAASNDSSTNSQIHVFSRGNILSVNEKTFSFAQTGITPKTNITKVHMVHRYCYCYWYCTISYPSWIIPTPHLLHSQKNMFSNRLIQLNCNKGSNISCHIMSNL